MADSLVLKGYKDVQKHTGTELVLQRPKRGGDKYPVKKWWAQNANQTRYAKCSVFAVTDGADTCYLALDTQEMSTVGVNHLGAFEFLFTIMAGIDRAALFTSDWELIEHYVFPKISGGRVMTVIPAGAAAKPGGAAAPTIGTVTVTGDATALDGETKTYTVSISGTASSLTYLWTVTGDGSVNGSATGASAQVDLASGTATVSCQVTASDAGVTDSPASGNIVVTTT